MLMLMLMLMLMSKLTVLQRNEVRARIASFPSSGLQHKVTSDVCRYTGSLMGHAFKSLAQMAPFVLIPYVDDEKEKPVWLVLSKVILMIIMFIAASR